MVRLTPVDTLAVSLFNDMLFLSGSNETRIKTLERNVSDTRNELMRLMRELELARQQPAVTPVSETALRDFFKAHPAMTITYDDGKLTLKSVNQSVAFHTRRDRNAVGRNNDIIYVTLPLYSFKLEFFSDGHVIGCAEKSNTLEEVWDGHISIKYGHPHTQHRSGSRTFDSLCNGNNRFIQDWSYMRSNGVMDGANTMRILSQAAIWMETANISDMYGTELACGPRVPDDIIDGLDVDDLYYDEIPIGEGAPTLRFIFDAYDLSVYRMALWSLWMVRHFDDLPDCLNRCASLYQAAMYDAWIILKHPHTFGAMYAQSRSEMMRVLPIASRCHAELGGYYPAYGSLDKPLSQSLPELFPENLNHNNMEANHESSQSTNENTDSGADQAIGQNSGQNLVPRFHVANTGVSASRSAETV